MARPVDSNLSNINPPIRGAGETAAQLKIDKKVLENVDKLIGTKAGSPEQLAKLLGTMGQEVLAYFRAVSESLGNLCSRLQESEIKSLHAQTVEPKLPEFAERDTSKGQLYTDRLPEDFLSVEKLNLAAKTGLLTHQQAEALKQLFGLSQETKQMRKEEMYYQTAMSPSQQERGQGEQRQQQQQDSHQSEDENWADFSVQGSGENASYSGSSQGIPEGGSFGGGSLRSSMRMGMGGGAGAAGAPFGPPPPPPRGGSTQNQSGGRSSGQPQNWTAMEESYLNSNFSPGDPYYGCFESLFGSENWYRNLAGNALSNIQKIRDAKQKIMAELAGLDPSKPGDAKKLYILQQKLGEMQMSERQWLDGISSAQKANNERKEYIKAILDIFFQTNSAIIRNLRQ